MELGKPLNVWAIPLHHLDTVWARVKPGLQRTLARTGSPVTTDDVLAVLKDDIYQLHYLTLGVDYVGFFVSQISRNSRGKTWMAVLFGYIVPEMSRRTDRWEAFIQVMTGWARSLGCSELHFYGGRKGYERLLPGHGFEPMVRIWRKKLSASSSPEPSADQP